MVCRAVGGRNERNSRAVLALGEKGLKTADTSVINLVSMAAEVGGGNSRGLLATCNSIIHEETHL
jgi:hypothetical protein